jgi:hypothetical protein
MNAVRREIDLSVGWRLGRQPSSAGSALRRLYDFLTTLDDYQRGSGGGEWLSPFLVIDNWRGMGHARCDNCLSGFRTAVLLFHFRCPKLDMNDNFIARRTAT